MSGRRKMLPKKNAPKGLYLYCKKHDRWYKNDNVVKCNCKLKYRAKIHVNGTKNKSKVHNIHAESAEVAIQLFQRFKLEMKQNDFQRVDIKEKFIRPVFVLDCIQDYMNFKKGINVPKYERVELNSRHLRNIELCCEYLVYALSDNNIDVKCFKFESFNTTVVDYITTYIAAKIKANKTYNNYTANIQDFAKYIHEKYYPELTNPFAKIKKFRVNKDTKAITKSEFLRLIDIVKPENGWGYEKSGEIRKRVFLYRPWLTDAFYLGLFTGGRNEETIEMKWSDIKLNEEGQMSRVEIIDFKKTRLAKDGGIENIQYTKTVEMTPEFQSFLEQMGYEEKKNTDEYIIAPAENLSRGYVKQLMSEGFTHFYNQLNLPIKKNFKHLRKTYVTNCYIETKDMKDFLIRTGHADIHTPLNHYVDMRMVMEARRKKLYEEREAVENSGKVDNMKSPNFQRED